jgi:tRNA A37 methylthiotransferase MiaB
MALILASNQIPRGTGETKLSSLFKNVPDPRQWTSTSSIPSGWTEETFKAFQESFKNYEAWRAKELYWIPYPILPKTAAAPIASKGLVCFTGFRNKALEETLKAKGYELAQSLTSSVKILVTSDDSTSESAKIKKARESKSVEVISCSEFVKKYLS